MKILNAQEQLAANDGYVCLAKVGRFQLLVLLVYPNVLGIYGVQKAYQIQTRAASKILHYNPKLVSPKKRTLVLSDERAGARAKDGYFRLYILDVIVVGLEVNLLTGVYY